MNEKIQNYLNKRKEEVALEREKEKQQLLENLKLGERVYSDNSTRTIEFPLYDDSLGSKLKAYKIDSAQDLTEEDYEVLVNNVKTIQNKVINGKYILTAVEKVLDKI